MFDITKLLSKMYLLWSLAIFSDTLIFVILTKYKDSYCKGFSECNLNCSKSLLEAEL